MRKIKAYECKWCHKIFRSKRECKCHERQTGMDMCRRREPSPIAKYYSDELLKASSLPMTGGKPLVWKKFNDGTSAQENKEATPT